MEANVQIPFCLCLHQKLCLELIFSLKTCVKCNNLALLHNVLSHFPPTMEAIMNPFDLLLALLGCWDCISVNAFQLLCHANSENLHHCILLEWPPTNSNQCALATYPQAGARLYHWLESPEPALNSSLCSSLVTCGLSLPSLFTLGIDPLCHGAQELGPRATRPQALEGVWLLKTLMTQGRNSP